MINARDVHEPEDERLPEEDEEVDTENDDLESEEDDEEELDEEEGDDQRLARPVILNRRGRSSSTNVMAAPVNAILSRNSVNSLSRILAIPVFTEVVSTGRSESTTPDS